MVKDINKFNILKVALYKDTVKWDVNQFFKTAITSKHPIDKLENHILHETRKIKPHEYPEKQFDILGISNEVGMFDAYSELGKNIKQPYIIVENGYLAYNPYRVNVGSIGIKTVNQNHSYISPAYVVFSCKETILPEYLYLLMKTETFNTLIRENTTGSVRQTLSYSKLIDISIPIPDTETQAKLIKDYESLIKKASHAEEEVKVLEASIDRILFEELELKYNLRGESIRDEKLLTTTHLSQCQRWSVNYLLNQSSLDFLHASKYKLVPARTFIDDCQYGLSSKASQNPDGVPMLRMNNIQNSKLNIDDIKYLPANTKNLKKYVLKKGDILFNRTNSKELVGKTAIFDLDGKYVFASYLIKVVINQRIADIEYINIVFASKIVRTQIDLVSRQILGQANVNAEEMKGLLFPLPPLDLQKRIVQTISTVKEEITLLREKAVAFRKQAETQFTKAVFGV